MNKNRHETEKNERMKKLLSASIVFNDNKKSRPRTLVDNRDFHAILNIHKNKLLPHKVHSEKNDVVTNNYIFCDNSG